MARKTTERIGSAGGAGTRLRKERERLCLSLTDFAAKVGVHRNTQTNYELGKREFDQAYVLAVQAVGVDIPYLLDGMRSEEVAAVETRSNLAAAVLHSLGYSDEDSEHIDDVVSALIDLHELSFGSSSDEYSTKLRAAAEILVLESPVMRAGFMLDSTLLASVIEGVEDAALAAGVTIQPNRKAQAITMLYRAFLASGKVDPAMTHDAVKLAS
jgi:transcriptional regulator with XRE-family HTH domain